MNKYQEAFETIAVIHGADGLVSQFLDLKELVDKSIPKKPIVVSEQFTHTGYDDLYIDVLKCPSCEQDVYFDRCCQNNDCRQAIDWSERYHEIFT